MDNIFAGLSTREMAKAVVLELRRRHLLGCVYFFHPEEGQGIFGSSTPADTIRDLPAAKQLALFAELAEQHLHEKATLLGDKKINPDSKEWVN